MEIVFALTKKTKKIFSLPPNLMVLTTHQGFANHKIMVVMLVNQVTLAVLVILFIQVIQVMIGQFHPAPV